jgi:hypothetical protein
LRLSAFCFRFSSFPFVIAGLDPAIHAEALLANASTGICQRRSSMDHRIKSGGDDFLTVACHSSGA